jgi:cell fate regulator YaaT (PSP1 superfamily)
MPLVVGISFKRAGKIYYFDPNGITLKEGDLVVAETARGMEFGEVMMETKEVRDEEIVSPLKKLVRKATQADINRQEKNRQREKNAYTTCQQRIQLHNLPMKLIDAEYCFDGSQVTFFFSADARVDFRELVKDLAGALRTKVQLHQVGVRDEAKLFGGMGPCGRGLCCATFLNGFEPVSMKMAKEQCLFLNPLKFSGICGKLMCCLKYEYQIYKDAKDNLPGMGSIVNTPNGPAKVIEVNVIKESVGLLYEDGSTTHCLVADLDGWTPRCPGQKGNCPSCRQPQPVAEPEQIRPEEPKIEAAANSAAETKTEPATPNAESPTGEQPKKRRPRRRPNRHRRPNTDGPPAEGPKPAEG